jgi:DNA-binding transcriptional regulator YhcF (GntR family)
VRDYSTSEQSALDIVAKRIELQPDSGYALYLQIAEAIEWCIVSGVLAPGSPLPSYGMLSVHLRVDRDTVMRAYRNFLMPRGLIVVRKGAGAVVAQCDRERALQETAKRQFGQIIRRAQSVGVCGDKLTQLFQQTMDALVA